MLFLSLKRKVSLYFLHWHHIISSVAQTSGLTEVKLLHQRGDFGRNEGNCKSQINSKDFSQKAESKEINEICHALVQLFI